MSTDDVGRPRTRAEARALREAEEAAQRASDPAPPTVDEAPTPVTPRMPAGPQARPEPQAKPEPEAKPGPQATRGNGRRFGIALAAVLGALVLVVAGLSAVSLFQGPRIASVSVDPAAAVEDSGTRLILTANQPLAEVDPAQVSVDPAVPFTVDTAGRGLGIRFTVPLDDDTEYTVTANDLTAAGGGPASTLTTSFRTPAAQLFLLQRDPEGDDVIFRTDLSGEKAVPVFRSESITDFRTTDDRLVVATEVDGLSQLRVMDRDGANEKELALPGTGYVARLQVSERGGLVGYTYTDQNVSADSGRAGVLVTQSLKGGEPTIVELPDNTPSIAEWQFVPDSSAALFIDFTGTLYIDDRSGDAGPTPLGLTQTIEGISRGTYTAIVQRDFQLLELDLADGSVSPLPASEPDFGIPRTIIPFPGGTLRHTTARDAAGLPTGQGIVRVDDDGAAEMLYSVTGSDVIVQACASPSGQYAAIVVAPNLVENRHDRSLLPLPMTLQMHILDTRTGDEQVVLSGFDPSWCATGPRL
ncbi:hypothetical protein GCM10025768_03210 [Microbacterium pseudoresistens]|uniref:SbsA Ig-like domain-containing protein n=1 Tax=Microbacterium pseudoresistens TaxID=640634 RepID=A0A7Y9JLW8_9MICO|nr:hypothetical protein [Microbacterium pseudoresistens]NYD54157.1 hypothetical protein [Microbacterium pseudoresistens]